MQPRLLAVLAFVALLAGCADPDDAPTTDTGDDDATSGDDVAQADGATQPGQAGAVAGTMLAVDETVTLALGDCSTVGSTQACVFNVGDPTRGGGANIAHVPFVGSAGRATGTATFTWTAESPLNQRLEARLALLECNADGCFTDTVLVSEQATSPYTIAITDVEVPDGLTLGLSVTRGEVAEGVRASTFQDVHVEASVTLA